MTLTRKCGKLESVIPGRLRLAEYERDKGESNPMKKILASLGALTLVLAIFLTGCDKKPDSSGTSSGTAVNDVAKDIAADYILDATPLGMPLQVYLHIGEDVPSS